MLSDFSSNLDVLRVEQTCALDVPNNDISAEAIINLITKTLQSWNDPKNHNFLELFHMLFTRLRHFNAIDDGDIDFTSFYIQTLNYYPATKIGHFIIYKLSLISS